MNFKLLEDELIVKNIPDDDTYFRIVKHLNRVGYAHSEDFNQAEFEENTLGMTVFLSKNEVEAVEVEKILDACFRKVELSLEEKKELLHEMYAGGWITRPYFKAQLADSSCDESSSSRSPLCP